MFLWLESPENQLNLHDHLDAIENLGEAGFRRSHFVLGDFGVIRAVSDLEHISRKAKAYYRTIAARYSTLAGLKREISPLLIRPDIIAPKVTQSGTRYVPLAFFATPQSTDIATLLCEHIYDCRVISEIGTQALKSKGLSGVALIQLTRSPGGGGGIHLALTEKLHNPFTFGICVVDSDRSHPQAQLGSTAKTCQTTHRSHSTENWRWILQILDARELENVVPLTYWEACGAEFECAYSSDHCHDSWEVFGFLDTKNGDNLCRFFRMGSSVAGKASVDSAIARLKPHTMPNSVSICIKSGQCQGHGECQLVAGNASRLKKLSEWIEKQGNRLPQVDVSNSPWLSPVARDVMTMGLGPRISFI